jgi:hypothetical protein
MSVSEFNLTIVMEQTLLHTGGFNIKIDKIKNVKMQSYIPIKLHSSKQILKKKLNSLLTQRIHDLLNVYRQHCMHIIHAIKTCQFGLRNALHMHLDNRLVFINRDRSLLTLQSRFLKHI